VFLGVAFFELFGVPFTGVVMGIVAEQVISNCFDSDDAEAIIQEPVSEEERQMLSVPNLQSVANASAAAWYRVARVRHPDAFLSDAADAITAVGGTIGWKDGG
jgi:hypothetical protein